ncbi:MAG: deaminase [bacterium]|nr:deaminase [bacterium]
MTAVIVAYVPVIHQGYLRFFSRHPEVSTIFILDLELTQTYEPLQKDIRALSPGEIQKSLKALLPEKTIEIATAEKLQQLNQPGQVVVVPDEDISHAVAQEFLTKATIEWESIFLRWDRESTVTAQTPTPSQKISADTFMSQALLLSEKSADWWRQVGAVLVKDGVVLLEAVNRHLPNQQQAYIDGDPRANFHKGEAIELSTAIHAEAGLIAQAAKEGISVAGSSLYVTTFPCPVCAKLVAESGITEVYYSHGYAMLDGQRILEDRGITLIEVASADLSPA